MTEGYSELVQQFIEKVGRVTEALQADRDHWKARAERAEARLEAERRVEAALDNQEGEQ